MKIKEKMLDVQLHYVENKKKWIIGCIIVLCAVLAIVLAATGVFHKKRQYNAQGIEICAKGDLYDITTGKPCKGVKIETAPECAPGDKFSIITGEPCPAPEESAQKIEEKVAETPAVVPTSQAPEAVVAPVVDTPPIVAPNPLPKVAGTGYQAMIEQYAGKAIKFDGSCKASPSEITVAPNTIVLVANESSQNRTIALGGKTSTIRPMHYDLMFVGTKGPYTATCDGVESGKVVVK